MENDRTEIEVEMHDDGSATLYLPQGQNLDRVSCCSRCMEPIGDEAYCRVKLPMAQVVEHARCVREYERVVEFVARRES